MTREEILEAIADDKTMPFIQPEQLAEIVDFVIKNYKPSLPSDLDKAAHSYAWEKQEHHIDFDGDEYLDYGPRYDAFKAGAEWMAGQDKEKIEQAFFSGYNECEDRMKKEFEKRAMAGEVNNTGYPTTIQLHTFDSSLKNGDKVNIIIMKQE